MAKKSSQHSFHIPVMGTGFTIDTPLAVAKYGISSVVSLVDDVLIEQMRKFWSRKNNEPYEAITSKDPDARAKRITAYLNLLHKIIKKQVAKLKSSSFEDSNSEINTYYGLLPDCEIKKIYQDMLKEADLDRKKELQDELRDAVVVGNIDVNIMTKLDCSHYRNGELLPYESNDAACALRGYANSDLSSYIVLSAGFNSHLYSYIANFDDFFPDANNNIKKKICLKVSDYRSAAIQGKFLAKKGLWVSEYRIESPLNCGGHAFVNDGHLLGPILEEFKQRKNELIETLHGFYKNALKSIKSICVGDTPNDVKITAQGGIGTHEEHDFLINYYKLDGVGWGSPFLLVPEVTDVDDEHLKKLLEAKEGDVFLSPNSSLSIPFWNLKNSASEEARRKRIEDGVPGSICVKGYTRLSFDFSPRPICRASRAYQKYKLQELEEKKGSMSEAQYIALREDILNKSCICNDLAGGAVLKHEIDLKATPAICPGPNILNFKKIATLKEMVDHIYGYCSLFINSERHHVFINELQLQINYLLQEVKNISLKLPARSQKKLEEVKVNLNNGIEYYRGIAKELLKEQQEKFLNMLQLLQDEINKIVLSGAVL